MGQPNSKEILSYSQTKTVTSKKRTKSGSLKKKSVALVSFSVNNPLLIGGSAECLSESGWREVCDTEAVNYSAVGARDSAILVSDKRRRTDISLPPSRVFNVISDRLEPAASIKNIPAGESTCLMSSGVKQTEGIPFSEGNSTLPIYLGIIQQDLVSEETTVAGGLQEKLEDPHKGNKSIKPEMKTTTKVSKSVLKQAPTSSDQTNVREATGLLYTPDNISSPHQSVDLHVPGSLMTDSLPSNKEIIHTHQNKVTVLSSTLPFNKECVENNEAITSHQKAFTRIIPCSRSYTNFTAEIKQRPPMSHSDSMEIIREGGSNQKRSILLRLPKIRAGKPSIGRNVRFQELVEDSAKSASMTDIRRGKTYGSVRLRKKKSKGTLPLPDRAIEPWTMSTEDLTSKSFAPPQENQTSLRNSVLQERDVFLELLSKVQDNRYENQRYTLKAGSVNDPEESNNDDVFEETGYRNGHDEADTITVSSSFTNGVLGSTSPELLPPSIEVSPESTLQKPRHSVSLDDLDIRREEVRESLSPDLLMAGSTLTPGRRSMQALKKMMECEGPYPLLIESPDRGYWVQNGEYESAKGEDDMWTAPEISTEHYTVQCDLTALAYGGHFRGQEHSNYIARDPNVGPVLLSMKFEKDYQGTQVRAILRTQSDTIYKVFPASQFLSSLDIPDYIRYVSADKITTDKAFKIELPKAPELIRKFDEHPVAKTHKIGVIYQRPEQTSEEEIFGNVKHSESLDEFLTMLGSKVTLKGFEGYRGGLDVNNDQTGEQSVHTVYKDREIMFHVSTLLPHDDSDPQHVQKKRHIGNDIVVIVFQEENTPFCPSAIRSHFIHSYIAVQVEHPNTDHTVYKVAVTAKDEVPLFGPPLPDPAVFQKGADFREWLLTKVLNAEFNCHMAPSFKKLANRTRAQLFLHLVEEIAQTMDDVDYPSLTKGMTSLVSGSDMNSAKTRRRRRRTLGGIFNIKKESPQNTLSSKRKSLAADPSRQIYRKLRSEPSSSRNMVVGSTPDLASPSTQKEHSPSEYTIMINGRPSVGHATPDLAELSRVDVKGKPRRRFTSKKPDSDDRKRPKRTKSFGGAAFSDYFRKRKEPTSPVINKHSPVKRESSEESSISSSLNWSVPYDLPSVVEAEMVTKRQHERLKVEHHSLPDRTKSNPTILERKESDLSISDVCLTIPGKLKMADAAVQVTPYDWSNPYLNSFTTSSSQNEFKILNPGHRKSNSLQNTPKILQRSGNSSSRYEISPKHNESSPFLLNGEGQRQSESEKRRLEDILKNIQFPSTHSLEQRASSEDREDMVIRRAESIDSISTDVGELYDSVLQSLQSLTEDVVRLREQNVVLSTENIKFASQNGRLKDKHRMMKKQLTITQKQINTLQLKLRLYQPNFTLEDEVEVTSV